LNLLLDTHIWIWSLIQPSKLSAAARKALSESNNQLFLSPISVWEAIVLHRKGRLDLRPDPFTWIENSLRAVPMQEAALNMFVAVESEKLEFNRKDPADRFIAATAVVYDLILVTRDSHFQNQSRFRVMKG
jgi:PIN domain nuclease of toxin-antitoxin system